MGFHDRYYSGDNWSPRQYGRGRSGGGFADWEVWKKLIAINVVVFLLQIFFTRHATEEDLLRSPYYDPDLLAEYEDEFADSLAADEDEEPGENGDPSDLADQAAAPDDADKQQVQGDADNADAVQVDKDQQDGQDATTESEGGPDESELMDESEPSVDELREMMREEMFAFVPRISIVQEWCELDSKKVEEGQIWRLITSGFCHDRHSIWHLLFNMLFLYWFGKRLEMILGADEFTAFYFASLLVASFAYIGLDLYTGTNVPAIGASGAVWGVVALYALMYPYERIYIYFLFPIEIRWFVLLYFILDLHPVLLALSGEVVYTGVAHAAHIGGAVFGFMYWYQNWRLMPIIDRLASRAPRTRRGSKVSRSESSILKFRTTDPDKLERHTEPKADQLDEVLEKISKQGRDQLTDDELKLLEDTSRRIREERQGDA